MAKGESEENVRDILVSRSAADSAAFALLYDIYYEKIFSYCVGRVRVRQIAEDLTSTTFLSAAQNISEFRGKTRTEFADWLYAIATKKINTQLGKKQTVKKLITAEIQDLRSDTITWPMLHNAILKLKPKDQAIVVLRFFENLAVDRIAEITGSKPNAVRLGIARALENIKIYGTENRLEDVAKKFDIDNTPDAGHKERLRTKILISFNSAARKKHRALLYSLAAAVIVIAAVLLLRPHNVGKILPALISVSKPPKQPAETNLPQPQAEKTRLEKIKQLAAEKNIAELLRILKGDDLTAKLLAAKYLAELTDSNTADVMKLVSPAEKQPDSNKTTAQKLEQQKTLCIKTADKKTKLPLAAVSLQIKFNNEKDMPGVSTDSNGQYLLELPAEPLNRLQIHAAMKGYAAMKIQRHLPPIIPDEILFEMPQTLEIGGLVLDEQLKSVENADVKVRIDSDPNSELPVVDTDEILKSDVNGVWRCSSFPQDACQVWIMATHPDYIPQENYQSALIEQLENLSYLTILEKGIAITGRVLDRDNKPLPATISRGAHYENRNSITCDGNGIFRFDNISPGAEVFTAQCPGAAPQIQQVDVGPNMPPMVFNLEPPKTIRARVVDINSTPLKDVSVKASSWHGFSSLNFETTTDANGFFRWPDAPADEVLFDFYKPGYAHIGNFGMTSENDYVITLETQ